MGKFVYVIPLTITLALSVSLFESLLILPAHILPGLMAQASAGKNGHLAEPGFVRFAIALKS